jgi:hypothetical protein
MGLLIFWLPIFLIALVPGAIVGWVIGQCRISDGRAALICAGLSAVVGLMCDQFNHWEPPSNSRLFDSAVLFTPPVALALWIGVLMGRPKVTNEVSSSESFTPLDPKHWPK